MRDNARQTTAAFMGRAAEWEPRPFARSGGGERDKAGWEGRSSLCRLFSFLPWKTPARTPSGPLPARKNNHTPLTPRPRRPSKHIRRALSGRKKKKKAAALHIHVHLPSSLNEAVFVAQTQSQHLPVSANISHLHNSSHSHARMCVFQHP